MFKRFKASLVVSLLLLTSLFVQVHLLSEEAFSASKEAADKKKYALSIAAIFKDEAPFFKEWIEYHRIVGVEHFYLYNNGSSDNFIEVLSPYIREGVVTLVDWPDRCKEAWGDKRYMWVYTTQVSAYEDAIKVKAIGETKWLAMIDIDEFMVPIQVDTVTALLNKYEAYPAVTILWQLYGTSGVQKLPPNTLHMEVLRRTSLPNDELNTSLMKTIVKPQEYERFKWPPHYCICKSDKPVVELTKAEIQLNHYVNRTLDYFYEHKVKKKERMDNVKLPEEQVQQWMNVGNDMEDKERHIDRFIPSLRKKMGFDP